MSQKKIPISEATEQQLRDFASTHLQLDIHHNAKLETVRSKVEQAWDKDEIFVDAPEEADMSGQAPQPVLNSQQPCPPGFVRIRIHQTEEPGGDEDVPIGVNGKINLVQREKDVTIPHEYYEALTRAIEYRYEMLPDGVNMNPVPRQIQKYPHSVISNGGPLPRPATKRAA